MGIRVGDIYLRRYPIGPGIIFIWILGAFGLSVAAYRWIAGLGATTALSDGRGWGIWISFDMMSGVALAAGAFTLSAVVYLFNLKEFYPIVRPAVLTGFISYILAALTLLVDLGLPLRIWHLLIYQNIHSPLFEVGICVMVYLMVLALEFSPIIFESLGWKVPLKWIHRFTVPLAILGAILSTMHQSTLGALLIAMPSKIHPLWYSSLMPVYFYLTAIAAGLAMTIFEMYQSARTYQYKFELRLASKLAKAIPVVLGIYLVIRSADLIISGNYVVLFQGGWPTLMFIAEVVGGVIFPACLLLDPFMRNHRDGIVWAATFVIGGLILNRFNSSLIFMSGDFYLPSWSEIAVSIGLTCLGLIIYDACIRFLPMFPEPSNETTKTF